MKSFPASVYQLIHLYPSVLLLYKRIAFFSYFCAGDFLYFATEIYRDTRTVVLHFILNNKINAKNNISSLIGRKFVKSLVSLIIKSFHSFTENQLWTVLM